MRHLDTYPVDVARQFGAHPRPIDDHHRAQLENLADALPGVDAGRRIIAHDGEELGTTMT